MTGNANATKRSWIWGVVFILIACTNLHAEVKMHKWSPAYVGIDQTSGYIKGKGVSVVYAMRVDLQAPGVNFLVTPHSGAKDTISETVEDFAQRTHVAVAINAGFFGPCCLAHPEPKTVIGLSISEGKVVSLPSKDDTYNEALLITRQNEASIGTIQSNTDFSKVFTAVTGSAIIVQKGENTGDVNQLNAAAHTNPRTAVGISHDGRYLYLVAIDGRHPGTA
jgi:exopolysaccharide biosynthesis protein